MLLKQDRVQLKNICILCLYVVNKGIYLIFINIIQVEWSPKINYPILQIFLTLNVTWYQSRNLNLFQEVLKKRRNSNKGLLSTDVILKLDPSGRAPSSSDYSGCYAFLRRTHLLSLVAIQHRCLVAWMEISFQI